MTELVRDGVVGAAKLLGEVVVGPLGVACAVEVWWCPAAWPCP